MAHKNIEQHTRKKWLTKNCKLRNKALEAVYGSSAWYTASEKNINCVFKLKKWAESWMQISVEEASCFLDDLIGCRLRKN